MVVCILLAPDEGYGCIDQVAIYITLVMAVDAIMDNLTDLYLLVAKSKEESSTYMMILIFKIVYNPIIAYLGWYLWSMAHQNWVDRNQTEYDDLTAKESPSE